MNTNHIEISGKLKIDTLYWKIRSPSNKECILVHLIVLEDEDNQKYSNIPIYIHEPTLQEFMMKNTAYNDEQVVLKGVLGVEKHHSKNKFGYFSPCYISLSNTDHSITLVEKN